MYLYYLKIPVSILDGWGQTKLFPQEEKMVTNKICKFLRAELPLITAVSWAGTVLVLSFVGPNFLDLSYGGPVLLIGTILAIGWGLVRAWSE